MESKMRRAPSMWAKPVAIKVGESARVEKVQAGAGYSQNQSGDGAVGTGRNAPRLS